MKMPKTRDAIPKIGMIDKGTIAPVILRSGLSLRTSEMEDLLRFILNYLYTSIQMKYIILIVSCQEAILEVMNKV